MAPTDQSLGCKWNNEAHMALCKALADAFKSSSGSGIAQHKEAIVQTLERAGHPFTWEATRQHLQKLRRKEPGGPGTAANSSPADSQGKTPRKRKATATPRGRKSTTAIEDADDLEPETPTKKPKKEQDNVKAEFKDEDDVAI